MKRAAYITRTGLAIGLVLALSACQSTTQSASQASVTQADVALLDDKMHEFAVDVGIAAAYAIPCNKSHGIKFIAKSRKDLIRIFVNDLRAQGYSKAQISAAFDRVDQEKRKKEVVAHLREMGVKNNDMGSFCVAGLKEIAEKKRASKWIKVYS